MIMMYGGYCIYQKNVSEVDERAMRVKKIEEKYLTQHADNVIKLQNF